MHNFSSWRVVGGSAVDELESMMWGLARSRECDSALEEVLLRDLGESAADAADAGIGRNGDASFSAVRGATEEGST